LRVRAIADVLACARLVRARLAIATARSFIAFHCGIAANCGIAMSWRITGTWSRGPGFPPAAGRSLISRVHTIPSSGILAPGHRVAIVVLLLVPDATAIHLRRTRGALFDFT
jgi:hypothetical protein